MTHQTEIAATIIFLLSILHTFSVKIFQRWANRYPSGSVRENLFHLLGEVEVIFGLWSFVFFILMTVQESYGVAQDYINSRNFTEPIFVFAVMVVASTKPIIDFSEWCISFVARLLPLPRSVAFYFSCLTFGPVIGSFITEPAAMTVIAMILLETFFKQNLSTQLKYATLGLLFVNISIGGTLTHFAAPPVVMVANTWGWDTVFMMKHFGWKAIVAIVITTVAITFRFRNELRQHKVSSTLRLRSPLAMSLIHLAFLGLIVGNAHHPKIFMSLLLLFLGFATVTKEYQSQLKVREGLLVGFFLGGLVTLGGLQTWWLNPIVTSLESWSLFLASIGLTAVFDNAALTYLGSLVPGISDSSKYALVAGAVVGGGLTVIANAPNPIGYGLLNPRFGSEGINPLLLLKAASLPTLIAAACFWFL